MASESARRIGLPEVRHVAKLAHLALGEDELHTMQEQLDSILDSMATLARLDTEGVEPTSSAIATHCKLREDVPRPSLRREEVLRAAAKSEAGAFAVPKVMEGE
jgi:aspartyl-tRNA(Asn)/glutamyl-tRNA(Gln) amidotransferase subunit C